MLTPPQQGVDRPAPAGMRSWRPQVPQEAGVRAATRFEGGGEVGQAGEVAGVVDRGRQGEDLRRPPGRLDRHGEERRRAEDAAAEQTALCGLFRAISLDGGLCSPYGE